LSLESAIEGLSANVSNVNDEELQAAVTKAEQQLPDSAESGYTSNSWTTYKTALTAANTLLERYVAQQETPIQETEESEQENEPAETAESEAAEESREESNNNSPEESGEEPNADALPEEESSESTTEGQEEATVPDAMALRGYAQRRSLPPITLFSNTGESEETQTVTDAELKAAKEALLAAIQGLAAAEQPNESAAAALSALIAQVEALTESLYEPDEWSELQEIVSEAKAALDESGTEISEIFGTLSEAKDTISEISDAPPPTTVDKSALNTAITTAQSKTPSQYTPASWDALQTALNTAINVKNNSGATQEQVNAATANLTDAINALVVKANKSELNATITTAKSKKESDYKSGWSTFTSALQAAETVAANENATTSEVNAACQNLISAMSGLVLKSDYLNALDGSLSWILSHTANPGVGSTSGEWAILARARAGKTDTAWKALYITALNSALRNGSESLTSKTDRERVVIAVSALGYDATKYPANGQTYDLTATFKNYAASPQINGDIFALIALDTKNYSGGTGQYVQRILSLQKSDGSWSQTGVSTETSYFDITAMAVQALSKHYGETGVSSAVNKALTWLNANLNSQTAVESVAQYIVALTALNQDPGSAAIDKLLTFYNPDTKAFRHTLSGSDNQMATEQAAYALVAYDRYKTGKNSLYDMTDAGIQPEQPSNISDSEAVSLAANALTWSVIRSGNTYEDEVTKNLNLPSYGENDVEITWNSSNTSYISRGGLVTRPAKNDTDRTVTLTAVITKGSVTQTKYFYLTVLKLDDSKITIKFRLVGDSKHDEPSKHTSYTDWITMRSITFDGVDSVTVYDVFVKALNAAGISYRIRDNNNYVWQINGLSEFDNGPNSGWMYMINGSHPNLGLNERYVYDGDTIVWHYVDDYTLEESDWEAAFPYGTPKGLGSTNSDATLKSLYLSSGTLSPSFSANTASYTATVPNSVKSVIVYATANSTDATVSGAGEKILDVGTNTYTVTVTAKDGTVKYYSITITRNSTDDAITEDTETTDEPTNYRYGDVKLSAWYNGAVDFVSDRGLMNGTGNGKFSPNGKLTRAMTWTIIARMAGIDTSGGDNWYSKALEWGKVQGVTDGSNPKGDITREELVTMLWRFAGEPASGGLTSGFNDAGSISAYANDAMKWAVEIGLVEGVGGGNLAPRGTATRAQAATLIMRYFEKVGL
jgi:hypothetical protein